MSQYVYTTSSGLGAGLLQPQLAQDVIARAGAATLWMPAQFSETALKEGRGYMTSQWRQSGVAALQSGADFKKPSTTKKADGKVSVPISNFWSDWNKEAAKALRPVMRALRNIDLPPFIDKNKLAELFANDFIAAIAQNEGKW